jgi:restriction system protein
MFTATSHDYGVDIIASKDGVKTAVQLKRYSNTVGRAAISDAVAGMAHYKCNQTMVVTSNYFTKEAKELASSNNCVLVDRDKLSEWIYNFQNK